jgi:hypothetical protein
MYIVVVSENKANRSTMLRELAVEETVQKMECLSQAPPQKRPCTSYGKHLTVSKECVNCKYGKYACDNRLST